MDTSGLKIEVPQEGEEALPLSGSQQSTVMLDDVSPSKDEMLAFNKNEQRSSPLKVDGVKQQKVMTTASSPAPMMEGTSSTGKCEARTIPSQPIGDDSATITAPADVGSSDNKQIIPKRLSGGIVLARSSLDHRGSHSSQSSQQQQQQPQAQQQEVRLSGPWQKLQEVIDEIGQMSPKASTPTPGTRRIFDFRGVTSGLSKHLEPQPQESTSPTTPVERDIGDSSNAVSADVEHEKPGGVDKDKEDINNEEQNESTWAHMKDKVVGTALDVTRKVRESETAHRIAEKAIGSWATSKEYAKPKVEKVVSVIQAKSAEVIKGARVMMESSARSFEDYVDSEDKDEFFEVLKTEKLTDLCICRRSQCTLPYHITKGCALTWTFRVKEYDIAFALRLRIQGMGGCSEEDIISSSYYNAGETHHGKWIASENAACILVFDNSFSLFRSKTLAYCVKVLKGKEGADMGMEEHLHSQAMGNEAGDVVNGEEESGRGMLPSEDLGIPLPLGEAASSRDILASEDFADTLPPQREGGDVLVEPGEEQEEAGDAAGGNSEQQPSSHDNNVVPQGDPDDTPLESFFDTPAN